MPTMRRLRSPPVALLALALGCGQAPAGAPDTHTGGTGARNGSGAPGDAAPSGNSDATLDATLDAALDAALPDASSLGDDEMTDAAAMPISWDGRVPSEHRVSDVACQHAREGGIGFDCPDTGAPPLPGNPCAANSDCTGGQNGVCLCAPDLIPPPSGSGQGLLYTQTFCSYDQCYLDSDCGSRTPCDCRDPNIFGSPNVCLSASNCAVDSDCGPPGFCSPSPVLGQTPDVGYFCHSPEDTCIDDVDCPVPKGPYQTQCRFDATSATWHCFEIVLIK